MRDADKTREQLLDEVQALRNYLAGTGNEYPPELPELPLNRLPLAYIRFDANHRVREWNTAAERLFGYARAEVLGRDILELIVTRPLDEALQKVLRRLHSGDPEAHSVNENRRKDGRAITCEWFNTPLTDAHGAFAGVISLAQDITPRRRVEAMLEENRRRFQAVFENALEAILLMDSIGRYHDANPACCDLLGYSREEVLQMTVYDVTPVELRSRLPEFLEKFLAAGTLSGEYTLLCKGGATRLVEFRSAANILPGLHLAIHRDITEWKRAEQESRTLNAALENAVEGIARLDRQGRYVSVNPAYASIVGSRPEVMIGTGWQATVFPDDLDQVRAAHQVMLQEGRAEVEARGLRPDGSEFWKRLVMVKAHNHQGQLQGHYCFVKDVTERKQAEVVLRESEERFRNAFDHAPVGMYLVGLDGHWLKVNRTLCDMVGYTEAELLATTWTAITHPDDLEPDLANVRRLLAGELPFYHMEMRYRHKAGPTVWVILGGSLVRDPQGQPLYFVGHVQDITKRKQGEDRLQDFSERVQALSRQLLTAQEVERRRLARELHDEFGQVLTAINFQLHAAKGLAGPAALARLDECTTLLRQAGDQVRSLALELRPAMLDTFGLETALRWLAERHQQRTGCVVRVQGHLSADAFTPELTIACFRVVQEALTNVARHARACQVDVELSESTDTLELVIRDNGSGFDAPAVQQQAIRDHRCGLLGMRERVELLGGRLVIESTLGGGTRLAAWFPLSTSPEPQP